MNQVHIQLVKRMQMFQVRGGSIIPLYVYIDRTNEMSMGLTREPM